MGHRADKICKEAKLVRELYYGDGHTCKNVRTCSYNQYISDEPSNIGVLRAALNSPDIKLIIAPTGAGKSSVILDEARKLVAEDKECRVIIALPSRALTLQMGNMNGVAKMIGGDSFDESSPVIATTYEKMFEVEAFINGQRAEHKDGRVILILDEAHLLTTQHLFRNEAISRMIRCIESNLFDSVLLVTATPAPLSLFHCNQIVEFESRNNKSAIDKVEVIAVDDVAEYIKTIDYNKEFPVVRLNSKAKIEDLMRQMSQNIVKLTAEDKNSKVYQEIVEESKIDTTGIDGILMTSVIEAGVNITEYPSNIVPTIVFFDNNIMADDVEQFLNRFRRSTNRHVKCARVIVRKANPRDIKVSLVTVDGSEICQFQKVEIENGDLTVCDTDLLDAVADGEYRLKIELGNSIQYRKFNVSSEGNTDMTRYSKIDVMPIFLHRVGFRAFIDILRANYRRCMDFQNTLTEYVTAFQEIRKLRAQRESVCGLRTDSLIKEDTHLIEQMTKGAISDMGELKECLNYKNGVIELDKRILYMISYNQFQRQYYYNHELLRTELEDRLNTKVTISEADTEKGKSCKGNVNDLWFLFRKS